MSNRIISDVKKPGYRQVVVETPHGVAQFAAMDSDQPLRFDVFAIFTDNEGDEWNVDSLQGRGLSKEEVKERWEAFKKFYNIEEVK